MEEYIIKGYKYKTDKEQEKTDDDNATRNIRAVATAYYMKPKEKKGRRMVTLRFGSGRKYHMPASDLAKVLEEVDYTCHKLEPDVDDI